MHSTNVGTLARLWRFPVKSMQGEQLEHAELLPPGLLGDRAFALIDVATGRVVSNFFQQFCTPAPN